MSQKTGFIKIVVPVLIIIAGIIIMKILISSRPTPEKEVKKDPGILVEVITAERENIAVMVKGTGTVEAAQEVSIIPQVSGRITYTASLLNVGGFFEKEEVLFEVEDTDYRLALERAMSSKAKAEFELATMESQARIARTEWVQINKNNGTPPNPLVLYEPQLKSARAELASASAQVEQAQIDLERTRIKAPFNARIRSENIDIGQFVTSGSSVAVLAGTDTAEIAVPLPLDDLRWLTIPRHGERQNGADASVHMKIGNDVYTWQGQVVRSTGEVDSKSRMMQLVVEIKDPYGLKNKKADDRPALAAGTFVDVHIKGRMLENVFILERTAFRDNSTVWIMDKENKLLIKKVAPLRVQGEKVIISEGINDGELIVKTNISGAADGMKLRLMKDQK
jgi:RND family efflux transporter MFP subunit